ncbi:hypothetical protein [Sphingobium yanoikuyae]|uniref:Uncharacterized protein n=1 Tax=Sphingobium yanoikuyae TaxID=13690 RepID=A0A0J9CWD4_SPHYA|nr:hypothetical protein [Sphingobium yanoikuyae]ATP20409.1 hypothetical protein BV87_19850 [Sphingobium yanoikuyae]KMW29254.1 hypothetical protein BV87_14720 [Sphingobium yanoikuyae]
MLSSLKLKLQNGARFDLPAAAINIVEERTGGEKGCCIGYDIGEGAADEALDDAYGFVKKQVIDAGGIQNPIEVTAVNQEGETHLVTLSRDRIVARREVLESPIGASTILTIASGQASFKLQVADTMDEMDGTTSPAAKRTRRAKA